MASRFFSSPIVAYAYITDPESGQDSDLDFLRRWCLKIPLQIDILAEEIHPDAPHRPQWSEILEGIERGEIDTLVVPSLFHIAGDDYIALSKLLNFLKAHQVTLKSLTELIDSRRDSKNDIILKLVHDTKKVGSVGGVR